MLGVIAAVSRSDLKFPEPLTLDSRSTCWWRSDSGGVAVSEAGSDASSSRRSPPWSSGADPAWTYPVLRFGGRLSAVDSAAIAAHYGSVSAVTFIAATNYLKSVDQSFESYSTAFLSP